MKAGTLAQLGEDALVRRLLKNAPPGRGVVTGAGDDCAVVRPLRPGWLQLLKTDCVVEGVHFQRHTPPERTGWKAMARAVSDMAAMGGAPQHALVTLLVPPDRRIGDMVKLYAGLKKCARRFGIGIVGGETSRAPMLAVIISLTGRVKTAQCVRRDGARAGDFICVTGRLGGSRRGRHLRFVPRVAEARWLVENFKPHAMMDLSDGLAKDLPRLAAAGGVEFVIEESALPVNRGCIAGQAWADGEDYELLLAVSPQLAVRLERAWRRQFSKIPLTRIGRFVPRGKGRAPAFAAGGWDHFSKQP